MIKLRPFQIDAIQELQKHSHIILTAPTGSGKSLIFQEYLRLNPMTRALLITPLNALSRQHVQHLKTEINPTTGSGVWVVSPEQLRLDQRIKDWSPNFLIVDEAHCVWEWGEEFRPDFKFILGLVNEWNIPKSFWCTATLPFMARQELLEALPSGVRQLGKFTVPPNLILTTQKIAPSDRDHALLCYCLERHEQLGIVFCSTRPLAERLGARFRKYNALCWVYHAGLSKEERTNLEQQLRTQEHGVIFATSAFGMGMDIRQIRYSVLFQPPFTMLSLMQALGRATRTEQLAEGMVYWHFDDFLRFEWMVRGNTKRRNELDIVKKWCRIHENKKHFIESYFNYAPNR